MWPASVVVFRTDLLLPVVWTDSKEGASGT